MQRAWPADAVERRPVASLLPYARNARIHSEAQVAQIAAAIREWGWTVPVLVDETGQLIAGHGRVLAAKALGLLDVPAMVARGWSEADKRAYALADNKLTLNAGWDADLLKGELFELRSEGFDLGLNPAAVVTDFKARAGGIQTIRDFEDFLREAGFSRDRAKAIASRGFKASADPRDEGGETAAVLAGIRRLQQILQP